MCRVSPISASSYGEPSNSTYAHSSSYVTPIGWSTRQLLQLTQWYVVVTDIKYLQPHLQSWTIDIPPLHPVRRQQHWASIQTHHLARSRSTIRNSKIRTYKCLRRLFLVIAHWMHGVLMNLRHADITSSRLARKVMVIRLLFTKSSCRKRSWPCSSW